MGGSKKIRGGQDKIFRTKIKKASSSGRRRGLAVELNRDDKSGRGKEYK